ncbi:outer membrane transport energization protein TonB [Luteibacter rhizovicinus]|uniref:Outer membrane transport energization protein TonB n=1 Tax=Luteibacter rhizovicinus TaxID=242606 RepID=A0A4R3YPA8_9GAMM|nr:energy transducer TonB [Luteibacter rhizovicinus]TCV94200.1 outer membrane transport energization protein TonB [Luteibacter rhizovicinus]
MTSRPTGADLIGATLLFSLLVHGVVVLGITFDFDKPKPSLPTLDVTLVDVANSEAPDKADFLAQANNSGGGDRDKAARPSEPVSGPLPTPNRGVVPTPKEASAPAPREAADAQLLTTSGATGFTVDTQKERTTQRERPVPVSDEEVERKLEMARLSAEVREQSQAYAKRPKKKYISSNTREYVYAAYMKGWVGRVERVGNLNYPDEARRQDMHGELVLTVGLNRDGSIKSMDVIKSSGHKLLDDAAQRIVRLSAPFPSLPPDKSKVDELYITRTWQFLPGNVLRNY